MSGETFLGHSMLENLHKISLTSIEKAPVTQPNIYSLASTYIFFASIVTDIFIGWHWHL